MSQSSFSPKYYEFLELIRYDIENSSDKTIEELKKPRTIDIPIPDNITVNEVKIDEKYRIKSKEYLENGLKKYEDVVDEKWKYFDNELCGEWIKINDQKDTGRVILYMFGGGYFMGSSKVSRPITFKLSEIAECSVFAIDYRLAPQYQFPAPLCDALAAYFYLINPGPEAGFKPFDPKQIVFAGTSAGGGLAVGTALFMRDIGLPLPSSLVLWSPWVDLTNSMASLWKPEMDKTDFVPKLTSSAYRTCTNIGPPCPMSIEFLDHVKILAEKIKKKKPNVVGHPSFTKIPRYHFYCANEALAIPYISPMLAESLGNLPPILCQVGGGERFLDSNILFSFRASDPNKYQLPKYTTTNFANSSFKNPTEVTLEVYDEAFHCFQAFVIDEKISQFSLKRAGDFIKQHIPNESSDEAESKSIQGKTNVQTTMNAIAINPNCEIRELDMEFLTCLEYENIGIFPDV
ncbi:2245_t:CDS:2 [Scutellospora calospora]|uniref:2245_t:CDS:1 n=1 Tax=Scutellospora calospora TaxID=85575 RepID=A0ACA9L038_9GLOM|nr:2245_t:CDS:2 [Scutellospora calospora]